MMSSIPSALRALLPRRAFLARPHPPPREAKFLAAARCRLSESSSSSSSSSSLPKPRLSWLDLRGLGLSAAERLAAEELLLRHDPSPNRCWAIVGMHEPTANRILDVPMPPYHHHDGDGDGGGGGGNWNAARNRKRASSERRRLDDDPFGHENEGSNRSCAIILGIGGKPERLIDVDAAREDGVLVLRRFSGGGTVVVDHSSLWTTIIGRNDALPEVRPYPREIMQWSADVVFGPAFESWNGEMLSASKGSDISEREGGRTLVFQGKSCGLGDGQSLTLPPKEGEGESRRTLASASAGHSPTFRLKENDYVLGERKVAGNAQSIVAGGFLHHTSFLWDFDESNMGYLTLPEKRPEYRGDRSHDEFLVRLRDHYGGGEGGRSSSSSSNNNKGSLFSHMKTAAGERFELEEASWNDVMRIADEKFGGLQGWFDGKCRTKVVKL